MPKKIAGNSYAHVFDNNQRRVWQLVTCDSRGNCEAKSPRGTINDALRAYDEYEAREDDAEVLISQYRVNPDDTCDLLRDLKVI